MTGSRKPREAGGAGADPERLRDGIARAIGCDPVDVDVRDTHISWLFLADERVFKLKKPLVLDFVDYGTAERRRAMCHEEVRLNTRLAPSMYLGVRGVATNAGALRLTDERDPDAFDYVVEMRRYDERQTLAAQARTERLHCDQVSAVGRLLAAFHDRCRACSVEDGARIARTEIEQNLHELHDYLADRGAQHRLLEVVRCLQHLLLAAEEMLDDRGRAGAIREGHGDLRAEHVILAPRLEIVDCVEFSRSLRTVDVADDLAFLVMDLCALGHEPAARQLVAAYRAAGGDCGPDALVWLYAAHRALVRVKVALIRAQQTAPADATARARAGDELLSVAERCAWRARGPGVIVICGVSASGKSHLAHTLSTIVQVPVLSTDVVRKQLAGLRPSDRAPAALYRSEASRRTYRELGAHAASLLAEGTGALVDGTFRRRVDREAFRDGLGGAGPVCFVQCLAPDAVLAQRAAARERDPERISDATAEIARAQRDTFEPLGEVAADAHIVLRTDRPDDETVADLLALLDTRIVRAK